MSEIGSSDNNSVSYFCPCQFTALNTFKTIDFLINLIDPIAVFTRIEEGQFIFESLYLILCAISHLSLLIKGMENPAVNPHPFLFEILTKRATGRSLATVDKTYILLPSVQKPILVIRFCKLIKNLRRDDARNQVGRKSEFLQFLPILFLNRIIFIPVSNGLRKFCAAMRAAMLSVGNYSPFPIAIH